MARSKSKVRDTVRSALNARDAHDLSPEQRAARAKHRDLRQMRALRGEKARQLEVLQAEVGQLDAQIARAQADLDAALKD